LDNIEPAAAGPDRSGQAADGNAEVVDAEFEEN